MTKKKEPAPKKPEMRNGPFNRRMHVLRDFLRAGGLTLDEARKPYRLTKRTVQRYLKGYLDAGFPFDEWEGDDGEKRFRLVLKDRLQDIADWLDTEHSVSFSVAIGQSSALKGNPQLYALMEDLQQKAQRHYSKADKELRGKVMKFFAPSSKGAWRKQSPDVVFALFEAWNKGLVCNVKYVSTKPGATQSVLQVAPCEIRPYDNALWLTYWSMKHGTPGVINLHGIDDVTVTDRPGRAPDSFDVDEFWDREFGIPRRGPKTKYHYVFDKFAAPFIRRREWNPRSEVLIERPDGGVELIFEVGASPEADALALQWPENCDVLLPLSLRFRIKKVGALYSERYADAVDPDLAPGDDPGKK